MATEDIQNDLIKFMFRRDENGNLDVMGCLGLWFGKSHDTDNEIRSRFGDLVAKGLRGGLNDWKETPRGCLALMILVDQFPRNIYRHTVHSFNGDAAARDIAYHRQDWLNVLSPEQMYLRSMSYHDASREFGRSGVRFTFL